MQLSLSPCSGAAVVAAGCGARAPARALSLRASQRQAAATAGSDVLEEAEDGRGPFLLDSGVLSSRTVDPASGVVSVSVQARARSERNVHDPRQLPAATGSVARAGRRRCAGCAPRLARYPSVQPGARHTSGRAASTRWSVDPARAASRECGPQLAPCARLYG